MSGRLLLIPLGGILNIWLCRSACPMPMRSTNYVLRDMDNQFKYVYLDDILIFFLVSPGAYSARQESASEAA